MEDNECPCLSALEMEIVENDDHFQQWVSKADDNGWEGVMLRKNVQYKGKRSKDILKVKTFFDSEFEVKDVIMEIFAESDKGKSLQIIENHRKLWLRVIGTRGHVGKKTINSSAQFNALFE